MYEGYYGIPGIALSNDDIFKWYGLAQNSGQNAPNIGRVTLLCYI